MQENKESMQYTNDINNKNLGLSEGNKLFPFSFTITFKILLIIHMIILFVLFLFFGLNHLILFVATLTVTIRMFLGIHNNISNYFVKGLFLFIWCFIAHAIKIIFRFILTYFIYKNKDNISNLKDMNIIETESILWIKGFDIKINGLWSIIILCIFMVFWLVLIVLFEISLKRMNFVIDEKERDKYLSLINDYYQNHPFDPAQANNNDNNNDNNNNNNVNNNLINNINVNVNINNDNANSHNII